LRDASIEHPDPGRYRDEEKNDQRAINAQGLAALSELRECRVTSGKRFSPKALFPDPAKVRHRYDLFSLEL
jgi:hypothetical protein